MAAAGDLSGHSIPQLRQLLVTVFGLLFGAALSAGPGMTSTHDAAAATAEAGLQAAGSSGAGLFSSNSGSAASSSIRVQGLLKELRECPLLPVFGRQGVLVPARASSSEDASSTSSTAVFFPVVGLMAADPGGTPAGAAGKAARSKRWVGGCVVHKGVSRGVPGLSKRYVLSMLVGPNPLSTSQAASHFCCLQCHLPLVSAALLIVGPPCVCVVCMCVCACVCFVPTTPGQASALALHTWTATRHPHSSLHQLSAAATSPNRSWQALLVVMMLQQLLLLALTVMVSSRAAAAVACCSLTLDCCSWRTHSSTASWCRDSR